MKMKYINYFFFYLKKDPFLFLSTHKKQTQNKKNSF
jgi:hypothetical protein